jgi:hypothetical protein
MKEGVKGYKYPTPKTAVRVPYASRPDDLTLRFRGGGRGD